MATNDPQNGTSGCFQLVVANGNSIWKSEMVLFSFLPDLISLISFMVLTINLLYYILRPFHQPRFVVGILTGLLLSREVLGGINEFTKKMIPPHSILATETIAYVGVIYYVFLAGLEMNLHTILRARKKATSIAVAGTLIPMAMGVGVYALLQSWYIGTHSYLSFFNTPKAYLFFALTYSVTGYPIVTQILADLKLLYTGLGKMALTAAMISEFYNWVLFALVIPFASDIKTGIYSILSTIAFVQFCFFVIRPYLVELIVKKTNKNEWDNYQMFFVVMGAYACAAVTDILGTHPVVGAMVYGIMIPRGKFTDMLIDKSEDFGIVFLASLLFTTCGLRMRLFHVFHTQGAVLVVVVLVLSCVPKILSTVIATLLCGLPALDGVALGFLMNSKGILPLILLNSAWDKKIFSEETYSILMTAVLIMTLIVPPVINAIYKPRTLYKQNKLRTIQNLKVEAELRVLACVYKPRQATGFVNILEAFNAIKLSPLRVFALQLIELTGNTTSLLSAHINQPNQQQNSTAQALTKSQQDFESIKNIFETYTQVTENITAETLSAVSTFSTIHEDIYHLAQEKQATLILLPYHKHSSSEGILEITNNVFKDINQSVMTDAPCSVGIFVDRGLGSLLKQNLHVLMLFIGGPDDREALAIAWRMSKNQGIRLSIVRILLCGEAAEDVTIPQIESSGLLSAVLDNEKQKELDDECVNAFRLEALNNEHCTSYSEKEVHSPEDIPHVLNELNQSGFDLYILGQRAGRNSIVFSDLMKWADSPELGVIGDMVASNNFDSRSSVLVVQQYGFGGIVFDNNTQSSSEMPPENDDSGTLFVKVD